jgi:hypothetical protein
MVDVCYPDGADWTCAYDQDTLDEMQADPDTLAVMERADALAWMMLSALTGYRLSLCPITILPCAARCSVQTWDVAPVGVGPFSPYIHNGRWFNGCGCQSANSCMCTELCEVIFPGSIGKIESVTFDGATLDPTAYRVDNGNRLVRTDGDCWPACNDGTFLVSYYPGVAPNDLFRYAAGLLAVEFYKACSGLDCRLPSGVTSIARAGMSITMDETITGDMSGIAEVDAIVRIYNPHALKGPSRVLSPDRQPGRIRTWGA